MAQVITRFTDVQYSIIEQINKAVIELGGESGLVANIMSWGDTMSDEDTLQNLKDWNNKKFADDLPEGLFTSND